MNKKTDKNTCYVFSQATLDLALKQWFSVESEKNKDKEKSLQITVVALPWLLKHLNQVGPIYTFAHIDLIRELEVWKSLQLARYSNQNDRIKETCDQLLSFFESDIVLDYKMVIEVL